jgi:hypothetical protein
LLNRLAKQIEEGPGHPYIGSVVASYFPEVFRDQIERAFQVIKAELGKKIAALKARTTQPVHALKKGQLKREERRGGFSLHPFKGKIIDVWA